MQEKTRFDGKNRGLLWSFPHTNPLRNVEITTIRNWILTAAKRDLKDQDQTRKLRI